MTAERKAGLHSHLRRTHRGHRTCLLQKLRRQLGGGGGRACEVSWSHKAGRTRGDQGSTETIWRNRPVGVRKNTASTVFFLLLPRVWWVSALIYNQGHQGEELQNKDKEVQHDDRSEAWGREQRKVKRERNILQVDLSALSFARPQQGTTERVKVRKAWAFWKGKEAVKSIVRKLYFKGNENSCSARAMWWKPLISYEFKENTD